MKKIIVSGILFLFSLSLWSQQEYEPRRILLYFSLDKESDITEEEKILLYETLLLELSQSSADIIILENPGEDIPPDSLQMNSNAIDLEADAWFWVHLKGSMDSITIVVKSYDILTYSFVVDREIERPQGASVRDLQRDFWSDLSILMIENYEVKLELEELKEIDEGEIIIKAEPNTIITGLTEEVLTVDESGLLKLKALVPATYTFKALCEGFYPLKQSIYMDKQVKVIELEQKKGSRVGLDFFMHNLSFPGFDFIFYIKRNYIFTKIGFTTFAIGIMFTGDGQNTDRDNSIFVHYPYSHINFLYGGYLNRENNLFRAYIALGFFLRIIHAKGIGVHLEPVSSFGTQAVLGLEISPFMKYRFYIEYNPVCYITKKPDFMMASFSEDHKPPGYIATNGAVFSLVNFRLGLRILF